MHKTLLALAMFGIATRAGSEAAKPSDVASAYLEQALSTIHQFHRGADRADWPEIVAKAETQIGGAVQTEDTYPAIRYILSALQEKHSFLLTPADVRWNERKASFAAGDQLLATPQPKSELIDGQFAKIILPSVSTVGADGKAISATYAADVRRLVVDLDKAPLCGWVIDLRTDYGGDMWAMLKGLDPLLGRGPFGSFVVAGRDVALWTRTPDGVIAAHPSARAVRSGYKLKNASAPVAVLVGARTASAGEQVAIAFVGRPRTKSFGETTAGLTTANSAHTLIDGAVLVLTEATVRDRTGKDYLGPIIPDEQTTNAEAIASAKKWLAAKCHRLRSH